MRLSQHQLLVHLQPRAIPDLHISKIVKDSLALQAASRHNAAIRTNKELTFFYTKNLYLGLWVNAPIKDVQNCKIKRVDVKLTKTDTPFKPDKVMYFFIFGIGADY